MDFKKKLEKLLDVVKFENNTSEENGYIYFLVDSSRYISHYYERFLMACGLQKKYGGKIVGWGNADENAKTIVESVGGHTAYFSEKKLGLLIKAFFLTLKYLLFFGKGERVFEFSYKGIKLGKLLADGIVRFNGSKTGRYTLDRLRIRDFYNVYAGMYYMVYSDWYFAKHKPIAYITSEQGHQFSIFLNVCKMHGGRTFICDYINLGLEIYGADGVQDYCGDVWNYVARKAYDRIEKIDYKSWVEKYLAERKQGITDWNATEAYGKNKKVISRDEWMELSGADRNKKNVFIMSHCFSDNAYTAVSESAYKDYYVWFVETTKLASKIDNVNWILKAHPSRNAYGEGDGIYDIYKKYQTKNMYIMGDEYSSESLYDVADVLLTVCGSCGVEFPLGGIPVIITGKAVYSGFGSVIEKIQREEYEEALQHLDDIPRLTDEQIDIAYKVAYAYFKGVHDDEKMFEIEDKYASMPDREQSNDEYVSKLIECYENGYSYKDSMAYQNGLNA